MITITRIKKIVFLLLNLNYLKIFLKYKVVPSIEHLNVLKDLNFNNVIDVGANNGQFSLLIDFQFPQKKIFLFEPNQDCIPTLKSIFYFKKNICMYFFALGNKTGIAELFITKANDSSSLLKPFHIKNYYKSSEHHKTNLVKIESGDFLDDDILKNSLLKIDVQGFELDVLRGFGNKIQLIKYIFIELSYVELYENQSLFVEVNNYLDQNGFVQINKYNDTKRKNITIQADFIYANKKN